DGLWWHVYQTLRITRSFPSSRLGVARRRFVIALNTALDARRSEKLSAWHQRLRTGLVDAISDMQNKEPEHCEQGADECSEEPVMSRVSFRDIVGRVSAVGQLTLRVRSRAHYHSLVLHGPMGVGKKTMARLYAKAILCERVTPQGF